MINKKNILRDLRDGGWEKKSEASHSYKEDVADASNDDMDEDSTPATSDSERYQCQDDEEEDQRIEGTTSYLPPEVVMGARPSFAADTWALGCVMYQCLSGRPPVSKVGSILAELKGFVREHALTSPSLFAVTSYLFLSF